MELDCLNTESETSETESEYKGGYKPRTVSVSCS